MTYTAEVKNNPNEIKELSPDEMLMAAGGTFDRNTYSKSTYHSVGISTSYHFFDKDEFRFMGTKITYSRANEIVDLANRVYNVINEGHQGANKIGFGETAFIRAFNSQLALKYGVQWDGVPGHDF